MAQLAIKAHPTRTKEVIEILEMLGGNNIHNYVTDCTCLGFYICDKTRNIYYDWIHNFEVEGVSIYTLEEFLEKFPYKVGDKVRTVYGRIGIINKPIWSNRDNCIRYELEADTDSFYFVNELQPYKEETMGKEISGAIVDRFICLEGYDFYDDKGNIIDTKEITMKKKQPKYPTTYEECCKVLDSDIAFYVDTHLYSDKLGILYKLLICRNAYWKIAGDWKPDFTNYEEKFIIACYYGKIYTTVATNYNRVLVFPTEEMRDSFYENFKELIESVKELI